MTHSKIKDAQLDELRQKDSRATTEFNSYVDVMIFYLRAVLVTAKSLAERKEGVLCTNFEFLYHFGSILVHVDKIIVKYVSW